MSEFERGDLVRIGPDVVPYSGKTGKVALVDRTMRHGVSVELELNGHVLCFAYAPAELVLVRAMVAAPRVVTVQL